jgi:UDP-N-acetyl-D-mannosaminuronic acid dehydrogenase
VGGGGHVGAPLAIVLANRGLRVLVLDTNPVVLEQLSRGAMPFVEEGGEAALAKALQAERLGFSSTSADLRGIPIIVLTVGTPIDEFHNPKISALIRCVDGLVPFLSDEQIVILRSTVAPGSTRVLHRHLASRGISADLAFCPERVVQGRAIMEIQTLPQIVSGTSPRALSKAVELFAKIAPETVEATIEEAEFAKLICNAYRYIEFAATNQLYMMVQSAGVDYHQLLKKMKHGYARMASIPGPGFTAGPCLMKDTMQLGSFSKQDFMLGHVAMVINEGMPAFVSDQLERHLSLDGATVGILGMAFKAESDDIRDSLSYKLVKILQFRGAKVLCSDEYVADPAFVSAQELLDRADAVIVGVPHRAYAKLSVRASTPVIDLWSILPGQS